MSSIATKVTKDCLFCKIVAGEIPCNKLSETESTLAFLDIYPTSKGHALVIPKYCAVKLHQLPTEAAAEIGPELIRVAKAITNATGCEDYNILQNNGSIAHQVVQHVHFHIIPKTDKDSGLGVQWPSKEGDKDELKKLQDLIVKELDGDNNADEE